MNSYFRYIFTLMICLLCSQSVVLAQRITVSAPSHVAVGENFRVAYMVNTDEVEDFKSGNIPAAFDIIAGPYTSRQLDYRLDNGHVSNNSSITFTYTLYAPKSGTYTIPVAHAVVKGKVIASRPVKITVSGKARNNGGAPTMHNDYDASQIRPAGSAISGNDLFIKVSANKRRVYEQEPILLTYKVYTLVELTQFNGEMPDLNGFHTQEVKLPQQKSFHLEKVNGRNYRCVTWSQYVMYPQMTGRLEIPSITFKGIVVQRNRSVDPLEAFFNGGSDYIEVKRNIVAPGVTVQVDPLPHHPTDFSGGVGKFNVTAQMNHEHVKAGDPISLRVIVDGIGNLKLIKQPELRLPKDFDKYDPKIIDRTKLTANGVEGSMIYDFLIVPRNQGTYTIPAISFTYYDTSLNAYKTLKTRSFNLTVEKGNGKGGGIADYSSDEDKDIHTLKLGETELYRDGKFYYGSSIYWISLLIPLVAFMALLIIFRKRAIDNADIVKMRGKKANQVATKHLKKANSLMQAGKQNEFYEEILRALCGYVGDKLNIPAEQLSRDNIAETLYEHDVNRATVGKFISAFDECEFERYAPGDAAGNMNKTFESAMTAIMDIEEVMKKEHNEKTKVRLNCTMLVFIIFMFVSLSSFAVTKENADLEYKKGNYQQAIKDYEELLKQGISPALYYNLGNAYFRTNNIAKAVLAYERAYMLSPGDKDIRFNLQFAQSRTIDKITPESEMFFITWYHSLVNLMSVDEWAALAIGSISIALCLVLVYLFGSYLIIRKIGFYGGVAFFLLFLLSNIMAYQQKQQFENRIGAIVMAPLASVKSAPVRNGNDEFVIHEGTRVDITDKSIKGWRGIRLADGREGWVLTSLIEEI